MNVTKKIEVLPYNPLWQEQFEAEAKQIKEALGGICSAIYHVGSTSVPGLAAKPKIDIIHKMIQELPNGCANISIFKFFSP